jgi:hypothetical protein
MEGSPCPKEVRLTCQNGRKQTIYPRRCAADFINFCPDQYGIEIEIFSRCHGTNPPVCD